MLKKIKIKNIIIVIIVILIIVLLKCLIDILIVRNQMRTAIHSITNTSDIGIYSSTCSKKAKQKIEIGTNVYILKSNIQKNGKEWCKVKVNKKVGYIESEYLSTYKKSEIKKVLMLDVSKFNMQNNFTTIGEFKAFILNNNIKYVYIRAGGRGYGEAGNFYTDQNYKEFAEACEYLQIPFGFYFLDEAITSQEVDEEVNFINDFISNNKYSNNILPIALDVEKHLEKGRADNIWDTRSNLVNELIVKLNDSGKNVIIYSNAKIANKYLTNVNAKLWLSYYPEITNIPDNWYSETTEDGAKNATLISKMVGWQFTESGVQNKIKEKVDISIVYNSFFAHDDMNDVVNDINGNNKKMMIILYYWNKRFYNSNVLSLITNCLYY